ncbi:amidohydrolase [Woeseia oceani]|uniref:amidohydrolase n=1 Tax=Woeseia oceani TaxID=1548547 RepID=UPI0009F6C72A|nr:amidohydrolase [Woeseia oceani]
MPRPSAALILLTIVLAACSGNSDDTAAPAAAANSKAPADLVLLNGKIATVDPALGNVEAMAVNGYQITAVGSTEDMAAYVGPETRVVELDGRFVMPGFIEGHGHYMGLGRAKQILDLSRVKNWDEVVNMVAVAVDKAKPGEWVFGRGWHQDKWDSVPDDAVDGVPRNDSLNAVSADNPVLLGHASGHAAFANDAALAAGGVDDNTPDPAGGTIVRAENGKATGLLRETAQRLINDAVNVYNNRLTPEESERIDRERVMLAGDEALRHGVTSFHDAGASFETIDFFKELEEEGALPVRLYVMVRSETNEEMDKLLPFYKMVSEGNDFLTVRSIKRQIDGALGAHGAWLLEPYVDLPDTAGLVLEPVADIEGTARVAVKHGYQVNTHAIGDRANRETLDIYERIWDEMGVDGKPLRWRIEHAQHIDPADVPRFAELGVIAAMQGIHGASDGPWIPSRLGEPRSGLTSYPWRTLIESGAIIGNGTDVPVEPIDAIASYYATVSRMTVKGERFHPEHVMTREEALTSYTLNNAIAAFEEDVKGTLTPGKYADFVVLSNDLLTVEEDKIPATEVLMTFVGGELKYSSED